MGRFGAFALRVGWVIGLACSLQAQSSLDVSVVKQHPDRAPCGESRVLAGGQIEISCFTLETVIREGLNILPNQLSGGADWVRRDLWDISAKAAGAAGKRDEEVYKQLLMAVADARFGLKLHSETRAAKGFALTVAAAGKLGPGLTLNSGQPHSLDVKPGPLLVAHAIGMNQLAEWLRLPVGASRLVEDKTGLSGLYDVELRWSPLQNTDADEPAIFAALREQLGLRLASVQVEQVSYEIQAAERPGLN